METIKQHPPVILLLESQAPDYYGEVKDWFAHSRFLTCEAVDVFEALEEMSDFTVRNRPDVILLNVESASGDLDLIRNIVCTAPGEPDIPIIAYSQTAKPAENDGCFTGTLPQLAARLESLIPKQSAYIN